MSEFYSANVKNLHFQTSFMDAREAPPVSNLAQKLMELPAFQAVFERLGGKAPSTLRVRVRRNEVLIKLCPSEGKYRPISKEIRSPTDWLEIKRIANDAIDAMKIADAVDSENTRLRALLDEKDAEILDLKGAVRRVTGHAKSALKTIMLLEKECKSVEKAKKAEKETLMARVRELEAELQRAKMLGGIAASNAHFFQKEMQALSS